MPFAFDHHPATMLVRKLDSMAALSDDEREAVARLPLRVQSLDARRDIVRDGDRSLRCCLLLRGWVCRYKLISEGRRQIISFHHPGDLPDLQTLYLPVADYGLATLTNATVGFIAHDSLQALAEEFPVVGSLLWRSMLIDASVCRAWMVGMGRRSAFEQVAHLFCETYLKLHAIGLADDYRCPLPITQVDLADALGLTSVHVNRVLKDLRSKSLVTLRNHTLVFDGWDELLRISEFDPTYLQLKSEGRDEPSPSAGARGNREPGHRELTSVC